MNWFKFYPRDYLRGVRPLTAEEAGVYMALLALMYEEGGAIPNDESWICGQARIKTRAWHRVRDRLCRLGKIIATEDGFLCNHRVLDEIEKAQNSVETHRKLSQKGGQTSAKVRAAAKENNALVEPPVEPTLKQYKISDIERDISAGTNVPAVRASKPKAPSWPLPDDWTPDPKARTFARTKCHLSDAEFDAAAAEFREFWLATPAEKRTAARWAIAFQSQLKRIATSTQLRAQLRLVTNEPSLNFDGVTDERGIQAPRGADQRRPLSQAEIAMRLAHEAAREGR